MMMMMMKKKKKKNLQLNYALSYLLNTFKHNMIYSYLYIIV